MNNPPWFEHEPIPYEGSNPHYKGRLICTCGDYNCASLDKLQPGYLPTEGHGQ